MRGAESHMRNNGHAHTESLMHTESLAHTERRATQMGGSPYLIAYGRLFRSTQRAWKASSCA